MTLIKMRAMTDRDPMRCKATLVESNGESHRCLWDDGHKGDHECAAGGNWTRCFGWLGPSHRSEDGHAPHAESQDGYAVG